MSQTKKETDQGYEILIAVEDEILRGVIEDVLNEVGKIYVIVEPDLLMEREYRDEHFFLLGTDSLERTKQIASDIQAKWGHLHEWSTLHYDFNFMYFTEPELTDEDVFSLWGIVGLDASLICNYGRGEYEQIRSYLRRMIGRDLPEDRHDVTEFNPGGGEATDRHVAEGKTWIVKTSKGLQRWRKRDLPLADKGFHA